MTVYLIHERHYTDDSGCDAISYYTMPHDLRGLYSAVGFKHFMKLLLFSDRFYFDEGLAEYNAKHKR